MALSWKSAGCPIVVPAKAGIQTIEGRPDIRLPGLAPSREKRSGRRYLVRWQGSLGGGMDISGGQMGHASQARTFRFTLDDLVEAITATVQPDGWERVGGTGNIYVLGGMLFVYQTPSTHDKIARLLSDLRKESGRIRSVTIRAFWLLLDAEQSSRLSSEKSRPAQGLPRELLSELASSSPARGQITCFDGQTVHIVSGQIKGTVSSLIPVVGQADGNR